MKTDEATLQVIENIREQFKEVAVRVSRLFFVLIQIMNVDPMYQYSLKFFRIIYEKALENSKEKPPFKTKQAKKNFYINEFT